MSTGVRARWRRVSHNPIIELIGIAGSGKSTLSASILAGLEAAGVQAWTSRELTDEFRRRRGLVRIAARLPFAGPPVREFHERRVEKRRRRAIQAYREGHATGWAIFEERVARLAETSSEESRIVRSFVERHVFLFVAHRYGAKRGRVLVSDEGIAQRAVNLFATRAAELDTATLARFLRGWALPDVLVHVRADVDRCSARIHARGLPKRLLGRGPDEVAAFLRSSGTVIDQIRAEGERRRAPILTIDNDGPLESSGESGLDVAVEELKRLVTH